MGDITSLKDKYIDYFHLFAQSVEAVEHTDCFSAEG